MTIFDAALQGIIQGATEFLPVSSSGHLSISQHMFGIELPGILFDIMLHLGTLLAVVFVYRQLVWRLIKEFGSLCNDVIHQKFKWSEMNRDRRLLMMLIIGLLPLFLLFLPIPGTGMKVKDFSEMLASDSSILMEGLSLLLTSALLFLGIFANRQTRQKRQEKAAHRRRPDNRLHPVHGGGVSGIVPLRIHPVCGLAAGCQPAGRPGLFLCPRDPFHCGGGFGILKGHRFSRGEHWRGPADCGHGSFHCGGFFGHQTAEVDRHHQ